MRRAAAILVVLAALVVAVLGTGAGSGGDYKVRAIFANAFSVVKGEDVKIAGVKVGSIASLDVTPDQQAAVVLSITRPGFQDFRRDATCTIRPQSLIGEKFVECLPTQTRADDTTPAPPPLRKLTGGPGKGQYLLPVSQTSRPVDLDLLNGILRLPYRQRLTVLLNEFGAGFAARGSDVRRLVRAADPALRSTDKVLLILANQNHTLQALAKDSDTIMAPLARERRHVAGFVAGAARTAQATAERRGALERTIQKLPAFLRQLKPTLTRLGSASDEITPVLSDLGAVSPSLSRLLLSLGPFSRAATPAFVSLGKASVPGRDALVKARPVIADLQQFGAAGKPLSKNLAALTASLHDSGGLERILDYAFYQTTAINGFDAFGHYLRAGLTLNLCSVYAIAPRDGCSARFAGAPAAPVPANAKRSPALLRMERVLRGESVDQVLGRNRKKRASGQAPAVAPLRLPAILPGQLPAATTPPSVVPDLKPTGPVGRLLDYLLGPGGLLP